MTSIITPSSLVPASPVRSSDELYRLRVEHHRQPSSETPEHTLSHHLVAMQLGRAIKVEGKLDGRSYKHLALPGDVSVLPAGLPTQERWEGLADYLVIRITPDLLSKLSPSKDTAFSPIPTVKTRDPLLQQVGLALFQELTGDARDSLYAESLVALLGAHLTRHYADSTQLSSDAKGGLTSQQAQAVTDYIHAHLTDDLSLERLAAVVGLSVYHFSRQFKRATGVTPYQYVLSLRIERATELLNGDRLSLAQVAFHVGFASQSHLTRHFKRVVGVTPAVYRRARTD